MLNRLNLRENTITVLNPKMTVFRGINKTIYCRNTVQQKLNGQMRKYFKLWIRGPDELESWKNGDTKISWHCLFKEVLVQKKNVNPFVTRKNQLTRIFANFQPRNYRFSGISNPQRFFYIFSYPFQDTGKTLVLTVYIPIFCCMYSA